MTKEKQKLINTFAGIKIEIYIFISSLLLALVYAFFDTNRIPESLLLFMLRSICIMADIGIFLSFAFFIDFKRGMILAYLLKVIVFLSLTEEDLMDKQKFVLKIIGIPFGLLLYYKIILFLIIYVYSFVVEMESQQLSEVRIPQHQNQQQEAQLDEDELSSSQQQTQTSQNISKSLRYYQEQKQYKKIEIFFFTIYFCTCILVLFPIQDYVIDYSKALNLSQKYDFLSNIHNLNEINSQLINYINFHTIVNITCFWIILLIGEFKIKTKYPQMIKDYIISMPWKFLFIQSSSLIILFSLIFILPISEDQSLSHITMWNLINIQIFGIAFLVHSLFPLFISFLLIRLYLGHVYYLNKLVSKKYGYHQNDEEENLDQQIYQLIQQNDLNKVRHFIINREDLIPRNKLKRYIEQQKLKQYVKQHQRVQIGNLFQDYMILDLYNKFSRLIVVVMFYITLLIFLFSLNVNDAYIINKDTFFPSKPSIILFLGLLLITKYESTSNLLYPKILTKLTVKLSQILASMKAYNIIRLVHLYAIIFTIWIYRLVSLLFLPDNQVTLISVKNTLYQFYSNPNMSKNQVISDLLDGYSQHFLSRAESCHYTHSLFTIDSIMIALSVIHIITLKFFYDRDQGKKQYCINNSKNIKSPLSILHFYLQYVMFRLVKRSIFRIFMCWNNIYGQQSKIT